MLERWRHHDKNRDSQIHGWHGGVNSLLPVLLSCLTLQSLQLLSRNILGERSYFMREKREMRRRKDVCTVSEPLDFSSLSYKCISFYLCYSLQLSFNMILSVPFKRCSSSWTPRIMPCSLPFPLCFSINTSLLMLFTSFFRTLKWNSV